MTWLAGMEGIAADYRHMEGYGVNTFTLINAEGKVTYVKFHWRPQAGKSKLATPSMKGSSCKAEAGSSPARCSTCNPQYAKGGGQKD